MSAMVSHITGVSIVCSNVCSGPEIKHQSSALLAFLRGFTGDRWISRTKDQQRGKCFHWMRSSWHKTVTTSSHHLTCDFRFILSWNKFYRVWDRFSKPGIIPGMGSANESRRYGATSDPIDQAHAQNDLWKHSQMSLHSYSSHMIGQVRGALWCAQCRVISDLVITGPKYTWWFSMIQCSCGLKQKKIYLFEF